MKNSEGSGEPTTRRLVLLSVFLLVTAATAVVFAQASTGHLAAMHASDTEATVVDYDVDDEGALDLTLRVHNPTIEALELENVRMNVYADGAQVTDGTTASFGDDGTVEPDETERVTITLGLRDGGGERLRNADRGEITVRGRLRVYVVDERVDVRIDGMEVAE